MSGAREQGCKYTRPLRGERVEAYGGNPADPEDPTGAQERFHLAEREATHMRTERSNGCGLQAECQQRSVVQAGQVWNREQQVAADAEHASNLRHGQPHILEVFEDLVTHHEVHGLIRPRESVTFQIHHRDGYAALGCLRRGPLEHLDAEGMTSTCNAGILEGGAPVPAADIEQSRHLSRGGNVPEQAQDRTMDLFEDQ